jgi:CMP-N,N'-diacetyllegionaminic acid synthase
MKILITICARGGSKGIPGKNIKPLNGKPLISYSIETAQKFAQKYQGRIALSTDSLEIRNVAEAFGLATDYVRPENLAGDRVGKIDTIRDLVLYQEKTDNSQFDYVLDLDITSPLRTVEDLETSFKMLQNDRKALTLFSVSPANRNPYFNMVQLRSDGYADLVMKGNTFKSRQEVPVVYDVNASFYFYKRAFFDLAWQTALTDTTLVYVVPHLCFDLDHPHDFSIMDVLLRENLLDFKL